MRERTGAQAGWPGMDKTNSLPPLARYLGYAGLLPQVLCVGLAAGQSAYAYTAIAGGFAYAAAIFSFLGGVWWGQGLHAPRKGQFAVAVLPSLIAVALFLPWTFGWTWPGPQLIILGAFIVLSPLVDRALGTTPRGFLALRWQLSAGLGTLTIALGFIADSIV